ncbi:MAG TPA: TonB-dependent receptor [Bryobacteraceae bacterium]|nr:TonB-dependent receptor [Bryobacteraceae bacterium]
MRIVSAFRLFVCAACSVTFVSQVHAQTEAATGVIAGTLRDQSGAVLPKATLQVRHTQTGLVREISSNDNGYYRFSLLPLGDYDMVISHEGFATLKRTGIHLSIGQELVVDLAMQLASVGQSVVVNAEAPVVETTRYDRTQVLNNQAIDNLPTNGRDFTNFVLLTPSANLIPSTQGNRISVGGGSEVTTGLSVDGADFKSPLRGLQTGATAPFLLSQEAVAEFEVVRAGFSAEFGRAQGGRINVVTKSGTNEFHGGAFYYFRDSSLSVDDALGRALNFRTQQFGGSLGGPMLKDKLFFFTAYDEQKSNFPTFSVLPAPLIQAADQVVPSLKLGDQSGRFTSTNDGINGFFKTDYILNSSNQISGRVNILSADAENIFNNPNMAFGTQRSQIDAVQTAILNYNFTRPTTLNELRFQYSRDSQPIVRNPLGAAFPTASVIVGGQSYLIGGQSSDIDPFIQGRWQVIDNVSRYVGKHYLKFGTDINLTGLNEFFASSARGSYNFQSLNAFLAGTPASFTQFVPLNGNTLRQAGTIDFSTREAALFAQDKYRILSNLTLDLGLRWEGESNDSARQNPAFPLAGPIPSSWKNFAPRVGLAWDPSRKNTTVVRLGAGIFYARTDGISIVRAFDTNGTKGASVTLTPNGPGGTLIPTFPAQFSNFSQLPANAIPPLNIDYVDPHFQLPRAFQWTGGVERQILTDLTVGIDFEMSNTVHGDQFRNTNLFPATKFDANGRPIYNRNIRPNPQFNQINAIQSSARATYNALIVSVQKRYSKHMQLQASYAYAHQRDNSGDSFNRVQGLVAQDSFNLKQDMGSSLQDVRHRAVLSGVFDLPFHALLSQTITWQSGVPFNGLLPNDANADGIFTDRAFVNGVSAPWNGYRQPRFFGWNMRLLKAFPLGKESRKLEASIEFFNLINAANFSTTNTTIGSASFGVRNVPGTPFQVQLGGRYKF